MALSRTATAFSSCPVEIVDVAERSVSADVAGVHRDSALELDDGFIVAAMYEGK